MDTKGRVPPEAVNKEDKPLKATKVTKIRQAKRRVAIRLLMILTGVFLMGNALGAAVCLLAVR